MDDSETALIEDIRAVAAAVGHTPSREEYTKHGSYSVTAVTRQFGSWDNAVVYAGFNPPTTTYAASKADLIAELQDLAAERDDPLTVDVMNTSGSYWAATYRARFGSWENALREAGVPTPETRTDPSPRITDVELHDELQRVTDQYGHTPEIHKFSTESRYNPRIYVDRFGSWRDALVAAGLEPECDSPTAIDLLVDLQRLRDWLEQPPTRADVRDHGEYSLSAYRQQFASWEAALTTAFEHADDC